MVRSREHDSAAISPAANRRIAGVPALWFVMIGPPIVWGLCFVLIFVVAQWACSAGFYEGTIAGFNLVDVIDLILVAIAAAVIVYASRLGFRIRKEEREAEGSGSDVARRRRFMALFGLMMAGVFLAGLIYLGITVLLIPPCL